jgi:Peptidase family S41
MLRFLYRGLLVLHPPLFRKRFAEEMQAIFDQIGSRSGRIRLVTDGVLSLLRQWSLRTEFWQEPAPVAGEASPKGIPSFLTLDPFRPRAAAVVQGITLSTLVFCLTCFSIRYSWIHVLHVRIPEVEFESPASHERAVPRPEPGPIRSRAAAPRQDSFSGSSRPSQTPPTKASVLAPAEGTEAGAERDLRPGPPGQEDKRRAWSPTRNVASRVAAVPGSGLSEIQLALSGAENLPVPRTRSVQSLIPIQKISDDEKHHVIELAAADLAKYYAEPDVARKMGAALEVHEKHGDDDAATEGADFADLVTRQMQDVSHDKQLILVYGAALAPDSPHPPSAAEIAAYRHKMERTNCGFEIVRVLPQNVGYLKFNSFPDAKICGQRAAAAMAQLNDVNAIIFDLRENPGGYSNMVALLATYLFDRPTHLNDFYNRSENTNEEDWTLAPVPGNHLADKPAFVLTSHLTFSAAEAFSYDLKMLKRATLVGETTSGRGHMAMGHRIDELFMIRIPGIKVVNPVSKTNWEGIGVRPDVEVLAADALTVAEKMAETAAPGK